MSGVVPLAGLRRNSLPIERTACKWHEGKLTKGRSGQSTGHSMESLGQRTKVRKGRKGTAEEWQEGKLTSFRRDSSPMAGEKGDQQ
jgi:hypothetical protein